MDARLAGGYCTSPGFGPGPGVGVVGTIRSRSILREGHRDLLTEPERGPAGLGGRDGPGVHGAPGGRSCGAPR